MPDRSIELTATRTGLAALAIAVALLGGADDARAGNTRSFFLGDGAAMTGGAVVANTRDSGALWYNPAGIGGVDHDKIDLSGSAFVLRLRTVPDALVTDLGFRERRKELSTNQWMIVPTALVWLRNITADVALGLGIFVTKADIVNLHDDFTVDLAGGDVSEGSFTQGTDYSFQYFQYHAGPAVGWQIADSFRFGAALFAVYESYVSNVQALARIHAVDSLGETTGFWMVGERYDESLLGLRAAAGIQWEIGSGWHTGLVLRSPLFGVYNWGESVYTEGYASIDGTPASEGDLWYEKDSFDEGGFEQTEPLEVSAGVAYEGGDWWIGVEGSFMPPMKNREYYIEYEPLWNVSLGGQFAISEALLGGAGLFTDNSPRSKPDDFLVEDVDYYGLTAGLELRTVLDVVEQGADEDRPAGEPTEQELLVFSTTFALRYALGVGQVGTLRYDVVDGEFVFPAADVIYHEIALHVGAGLEF